MRGARLLPRQTRALDDVDDVIEDEAHDHQREQANPYGVEVVQARGGVDEVTEPALRRDEFADHGADQSESDIDAEGRDDRRKRRRHHGLEENLMLVRAHRYRERLQVDVGVFGGLIGRYQRHDGRQRYRQGDFGHQPGAEPEHNDRRQRDLRHAVDGDDERFDQPG